MCVSLWLFGLALVFCGLCCRSLSCGPWHGVQLTQTFGSMTYPKEMRSCCSDNKLVSSLFPHPIPFAFEPSETCADVILQLRSVSLSGRHVVVTTPAIFTPACAIQRCCALPPFSHSCVRG